LGHTSSIIVNSIKNKILEEKYKIDGSTTIQIKEWDECYHSKHGAIQEAQHVYKKRTFLFEKEVSILEIGFGTGLNAFITFWKDEK
jgi:tRNA U34 5-methylaminomethyl-2-thiouridine-forming methyltransferase MnmC